MFQIFNSFDFPIITEAQGKVAKRNRTQASAFCSSSQNCLPIWNKTPTQEDVEKKLTADFLSPDNTIKKNQKNI